MTIIKLRKGKGEGGGKVEPGKKRERVNEEVEGVDTTMKAAAITWDSPALYGRASCLQMPAYEYYFWFKCSTPPTGDPHKERVTQS